MAIQTTTPNAWSPSNYGRPGFSGTTSFIADPDIVAQGNVQSKLQAQAQANQQRLQSEQLAAAQRLQDQQLGFQRDRFNTVYGALQNQLGALNNNAALVGGQSGQGPNLGGGQIWGAQDIQQNLNANRASTDRQVATQNRDMRNNLAGRGFGSRSPLAAALEQQTNMAGMGAKADYARQFVPQARQQNAAFGLETGQARERQFASRQNEDIERRRTNANQQTSILNVLGGLI